jgi:hypothetical protein
MPNSNVYASEAKASERRKVKRICGDSVGGTVDVSEQGVIPSHSERRRQNWQTEPISPEGTPWEEAHDIRGRK